MHVFGFGGLGLPWLVGLVISLVLLGES